ncbi:MAG: hypothetical protein AMS17_08410 [Spirochaetes bacterium DG_61]|nr:MAG: hypothetical protein AMS17_08410 [Spirochaetes bacterium DG_61]
MTYPEWIRTGKKAALDYAKERVKDILQTHNVPKLNEKQDLEVQKILDEARNYYRKKGLL